MVKLPGKLILWKQLDRSQVARLACLITFDDLDFVLIRLYSALAAGEASVVVLLADVVSEFFASTCP